MNQVQPCLPCLGYPNSSGDLFFSISPVAAIPMSFCLLYLTKLPLFSFDDFQFLSAIFVGLLTIFSDGTFHTHCLDLQAGWVIPLLLATLTAIL